MTPNTTPDRSTNAEPSAGWRPGQCCAKCGKPRKFRERKSVPHTIDGAAAMLRSIARRPDFDTPNLAQLAALADQLDVALTIAVDNLRGQGQSWAAIARELGITRQSAHERFTRHGLG